MDYLIRRALPEDGSNIVAHTKICMVESKAQLLTEIDEFNMTSETQAELIQNLGENDLFLIAEVQGIIVGTLTLFQKRRKKYKHVAEFGMAVQKRYMNLGIGSRLLKDMLSFVEHQKTLKKIELEVFATNQQAISLYQKQGFTEEGRLSRRAIING